MSRPVFTSNPPFIEIRCSEPNPFYFARRRGKDSVAVMVYDSSSRNVLLRMQSLVHKDDGDSQELFACPITGSMEPGMTPYEVAAMEVREEAGYDPFYRSLAPIGHYIVGTQTDEVVHLFAFDAAGLEAGISQGDGTYHESISKNVWVPYESAWGWAEYSGLIIGLVRLRAYGLI